MTTVSGDRFGIPSQIDFGIGFFCTSMINCRYHGEGLPIYQTLNYAYKSYKLPQSISELGSMPLCNICTNQLDCLGGARNMLFTPCGP